MTEDRILKHMIKLPVVKRTRQYICGQWSYVYPPTKEKNHGKTTLLQKKSS